jgi:uncharacterized paraquat-inducible protein A
MVVTVECRECGYITDFETLSETNPSRCPKCQGTLWVAGIDQTYADYLESAHDDDPAE